MLAQEVGTSKSPPLQAGALAGATVPNPAQSGPAPSAPVYLTDAERNPLEDLLYSPDLPSPMEEEEVVEVAPQRSKPVAAIPKRKDLKQVEFEYLQYRTENTTPFPLIAREWCSKQPQAGTQGGADAGAATRSSVAPVQQLIELSLRQTPLVSARPCFTLPCRGLSTTPCR